MCPARQVCSRLDCSWTRPTALPFRLYRLCRLPVVRLPRPSLRSFSIPPPPADDFPLPAVPHRRRWCTLGNGEARTVGPGVPNLTAAVGGVRSKQHLRTSAAVSPTRRPADSGRTSQQNSSGHSPRRATLPELQVSRRLTFPSAGGGCRGVHLTPPRPARHSTRPQNTRPFRLPRPSTRDARAPSNAHPGVPCRPSRWNRRNR